MPTSWGCSPNVEMPAPHCVSTACASHRTMIGVGRAWMNFLGPLLLRLDNRQPVQLRIRGLIAGFCAVEPSVDVNARPLGTVSLTHATWHSQDRKGTYGGAGIQNNTISPYSSGYISIQSDWQCWPLGAVGCIHFPIRDDEDPERLPATIHTHAGINEFRG